MFDLVDHAILLEKLATLNISRSFWEWGQSYLSRQTQVPSLIMIGNEVLDRVEVFKLLGVHVHAEGLKMERTYRCYCN